MVIGRQLAGSFRSPSFGTSVVHSFMRESRIRTFAKQPSVGTKPCWFFFRSTTAVTLGMRTRCKSLCTTDPMVMGLQFVACFLSLPVLSTRGGILFLPIR
ncbi:hypothetical protein Zmor_005971 [Zophobas morio]|uniref:Uncharacterized protein n=1 Tax=Zophobas morio TaxID=2755281 RepID=A0AA38ML11_9CUCU|nr:hypothetical protein Zmor_005971 [Zophobas morio]